MTPLEIALAAYGSTMTFATVLCGRWGLRVKARSIDLERTAYAFKNGEAMWCAAAHELAIQRDRALAAPLRLDAQTVALVRLATSNPDRNESASSALIVCERLKKRLG
jgi:hypothetical protein